MGAQDRTSTSYDSKNDAGMGGNVKKRGQDDNTSAADSDNDSDSEDEGSDDSTSQRK